MTSSKMWFIVEMYWEVHPFIMEQRGETDMKRFVVIVLTAALLFSTCVTGSYAYGTGALVQKKVMFYLKPDISIEINGVRQVFKDANGQMVYPIVYNGTAYLPIRAISAIMKEPVEWDGRSKSIYIGKTLKNPVKSEAVISADAVQEASRSDISFLNGEQPVLVTGYSKPDIFVMYDFVIQTFKDVNDATVYPLNYNGSTYLPVRAASRLMNEPIVWDGTAKLISIGSGEEEPDEEVDEEITNDKDAEKEAEKAAAKAAEKADKAAAALLKDLYEREEALYYEATAKITNIKKASADEKKAIAASASENYLNAQALTLEIKNIKQENFKDDKKAACAKLQTFAESNEYYILVLENIAYLAAADSDYSMLADTFLYFAVEAQNTMRTARELIIIE